MKSLLGVCLIAAGIIGMVVTQGAAKAVLQRGISVKMPVANEAVAMPGADEAGATIVAVTVDGKLYLGTEQATADALARVPASTVYVKADARASYQQVLTVLEALHGRSVVLLTASTARTEPGIITPPFGVRMTLGDKGSD